MEPPVITMQIAMLLGVVLVTIFLFISEWLRVDVVAILVMLLLPIMGLVDGRETFQGLSSTAAVSIIAVIIIGRGLDQTGVISRSVRPLLKIAGASRRRMIVLMSGNRISSQWLNTIRIGYAKNACSCMAMIALLSK